MITSAGGNAVVVEANAGAGDRHTLGPESTRRLLGKGVVGVVYIREGEGPLFAFVLNAIATSDKPRMYLHAREAEADATFFAHPPIKRNC